MLDLARYLGQTSWVNGVVWSQQLLLRCGQHGHRQYEVAGLARDRSSRARQAFHKLADAASGISLHGDSLACSDA